MLELNGITVECIIGELPDERLRPQQLRIDLALELAETAAETDDLADTVDYAALTESVRAALVKAQCRMIERAAKVVLTLCRAETKVRHARVRVTKAGAIEHLKSASVTIEG